MQPEITIHDYPCGSGKTTAMIKSFKEDRKYLVILPLLSEVDRVVETVTKVSFSQPSKNDNEAGTKEASLEEMLLIGQNIATTHSLHQRLVSMARRGLLDDYDIIIDAIGGWTTEGIGHQYGKGHSLTVIHGWMGKLAAFRLVSSKIN